MINLTKIFYWRFKNMSKTKVVGVMVVAATIGLSACCKKERDKVAGLEKQVTELKSQLDSANAAKENAERAKASLQAQVSQLSEAKSQCEAKVQELSKKPEKKAPAKAPAKKSPKKK